MTKADALAAFELWLNSQVLKVPVVVEDVKQRSSKGKPPGGFEVQISPRPEAAQSAESATGVIRVPFDPTKDQGEA